MRTLCKDTFIFAKTNGLLVKYFLTALMAGSHQASLDPKTFVFDFFVALLCEASPCRYISYTDLMKVNFQQSL